MALALLLAGPAARAQAPPWQAAISVGTGGGSSEVRATVVDATGNVYLTGGFTGTIQLGATTLSSAGQDEVFVAKWSGTTASFAWAVRAGGTDIDFPNAIAVSGNSVYVAGAFNSLSASFGPFTLPNANTSPSQRAADSFVAKLTDVGSSASFSWAVRAGGTATDAVQALAVVGSSIYLGGLYNDSFALGAYTLVSAGGSDFFVARLTDTGTTASADWAVSGGGTSNDELDGLAVSGSSLYAAGDFENTATLGSQAVSSAGRSDVFVAKLTDAGSSASYVWARAAGGSDGEYLRRLAVSGSSVYVAGEFASATAAFGTAMLTNASANTDGYVAKLTDAGATASFTWAQRLGGAGYDNAAALAVRGNSLYVAGHFDGASTSLGTTTLANSGAAGTYDLYVGRLLDAGSTAGFVWARQAGSPANDFIRSLTIGGTTLYAAGSVGLPATFGTQVLAGPAGSSASFFATLSDVTGLPTRPVAEALASLSLYPNPSHNLASLTIPAGAAPAALTLLDALGRRVRTATAPAGQDYSLSLAGLTLGVYVLRMQVGEEVATRRLVVE